MNHFEYEFSLMDIVDVESLNETWQYAGVHPKNDFSPNHGWITEEALTETSSLGNYECILIYLYLDRYTYMHIAY